MRFAIDSNVLIYAEGVEDRNKRERALRLIEAIPAGRIVLPLQVIGETTRWLFGKGKLGKKAAAERATWWLTSYPIQETTRPVFENALDLLGKHDMQLWDAIILSAAAEAKADALLSEDMHDGFKWRGVTIMNPFAAVLSPPLRRLLSIK